MIRLIDVYEWNLAKQTFILDIMRYNSPAIRGQLDFFGSEYGKLIRYLDKFQLHNLIQICTPGCVNDGAILRNQTDTIYLNKINNNVVLHSMHTRLCQACQVHCDVLIDFGTNNPNFILIQTVTRSIIFNEMPKILEINNRRYQLLCATALEENRAHFISIFE